MATGFLHGHQYLLLVMLVLLLPFIPGSKYLLPAKKKFISNTEYRQTEPILIVSFNYVGGGGGDKKLLKISVA